MKSKTRTNFMKYYMYIYIKRRSFYFCYNFVILFLYQEVVERFDLKLIYSCDKKRAVFLHFLKLFYALFRTQSTVCWTHLVFIAHIQASRFCSIKLLAKW